LDLSNATDIFSNKQIKLINISTISKSSFYYLVISKSYSWSKIKYIKMFKKFKLCIFKFITAEEKYWVHAYYFNISKIFIIKHLKTNSLV